MRIITAKYNKIKLDQLKDSDAATTASHGFTQVERLGVNIRWQRRRHYERTGDTSIEAAMQTSPPCSHKHIKRTHTHTRWHTGCLESKTIFPGSRSQGRRHGNWLTHKILLSLRGSLKPVMSGAHGCVNVCVCGFVLDRHETLQGYQNWSLEGQIWKVIWHKYTNTQKC